MPNLSMRFNLVLDNVKEMDNARLSTDLKNIIGGENVVDSINVVIQGIRFIDEEHLKQLGIKDFKIFGPRQYSFTYKGVSFSYYNDYRNLAIKTTTHKILNKKDIKLSDKAEFVKRLNSIVNQVLNTKGIDYNMKLTEIDYCSDVNVGDDRKEEYIKLLNKHLRRFKQKEKKRIYKESIQVTTKSGGIVKGYNKEAEIIYKYNEKREDLLNNNDEKIIKQELDNLKKRTQAEIEKYKGVIRLEIAMRKSNLKYYLKGSSKKHSKDKNVPIEHRTIDNYWNKEKMEKHFFKEFKSYLYEGDYYKLDLAVNKIKESDISNSWKNKLTKFLQDISKSSIQNVKDNMPNGTFRNYIKQLNMLKINSITIDENSKYDCLKSLYSLAVEQAENVYFD